MTAEPQSGTTAAVTGSTRRATGHVLSAECREAILKVRQNYPQARAAVLPALHLAQAEVGYLPRPVVDEVADLLGVLPIHVQEVVSFYPMFHAEKVGPLPHSGVHQYCLCTRRRAQAGAPARVGTRRPRG